MSHMTYSRFRECGRQATPLVTWRSQTPPFSRDARLEAGLLLRRLQQGENLALPHSRPMPDIGPRCHEVRVKDVNKTWRVLYRVDDDAILVVEVFKKKTRATPRQIIANCKRRQRLYGQAARDRA